MFVFPVCNTRCFVWPVLLLYRLYCLLCVIAKLVRTVSHFSIWTLGIKDCLYEKDHFSYHWNDSVWLMLYLQREKNRNLWSLVCSCHANKFKLILGYLSERKEKHWKWLWYSGDLKVYSQFLVFVFVFFKSLRISEEFRYSKLLVCILNTNQVMVFCMCHVCSWN